MKKILLTFVTALMVVISSYATPIDRRDGFVDVAEFDKIMVNASAKVRVLQADTFSINVICPDNLIRNGIKYEVKDGILNIRAIEDIDLEQSRLRIYVTTPKNAPEILTGNGFRIIKSKDDNDNVI